MLNICKNDELLLSDDFAINFSRANETYKIPLKGLTSMYNHLNNMIVFVYGFKNEIGGKTGTAQKSFNGIYSKNKVNTFAAVFPISSPKFVLIVLLDEPKACFNLRICGMCVN